MAVVRPSDSRSASDSVRSINLAPSFFSTPGVNSSGRGGFPLEGVDGLTVPGYTGAIGAKAHLYPRGGNCLSTTAVKDAPGMPFFPPQDHQTNSYLEPLAKPLNRSLKIASKLFPQKCGLWAVVGTCQNGHRFAKRLDCGRQWCQTCREATHNRRLARTLPRAQQILPLQYWVVRPPDELQPLLRSRVARGRFIQRIKKAFKTIGYDRGLTFIHYFGDKSPKYAFHLNVLVDGGHLDPAILDTLKCELRRLIYPERVIDRWGDKLDIWMNWRGTRPKILHTLRYCTKATFLDRSWDEPLSSTVFRERTASWWGNWRQPVKWQLSKSERRLETLVSLETGKCPVCGEPLEWAKRLAPMVLILMENPASLSSGYYRLPNERPPPVSRF
ncbi:hypothetical protein ES703_88235 [subsurface metagenome]